MGGILRTPEGGIDYKPDFSGKPTFLSVLGQLQAECYACALPMSTPLAPSAGWASTSSLGSAAIITETICLLPLAGIHHFSQRS